MQCNTHIKKTWVNYNTQYPLPSHPFYFRDLLRCVTCHLISNDDYSYARLLV